MSTGVHVSLSALPLGRSPRVTTGLPGLDRLLDTLRPWLLVVTGRPRVGRSTIAWQTARRTSSLGVGVQLVSAREDAGEVSVALLSGESGVPRHHLQDRRVSLADESLATAQRRLVADGLTITSASSQGPTLGPHDFLGAGGSGLVVVDDVDLWDADWLDHLGWYRTWAKGNASAVLVTVPEQPVGSRPAMTDVLIRQADVLICLAAEHRDRASVADVLRLTLYGPDGVVMGAVRAELHGHVCRVTEAADKQKSDLDLLDVLGDPALPSG